MSDQSTHKKYRCDCFDGYWGDFCEMDLNGCMVLGVCKNGGSCENLPGEDVKCFCQVGFTGKYCDEFVDFCGFDDCLNGGTCVTTIDGRKQCSCSADFRGENCEIPSSSCLVKKCQNFGKCDVENHICVCEAGFDGDFCQLETTKCDEEQLSLCYMYGTKECTDWFFRNVTENMEKVKKGQQIS